MLQQDMVVLRERVAQVQAGLTNAIELERNLEAQVVIEKLSYLRDIARGDLRTTDGDGPTGKPKRKRSPR